MNKKQRHIAKPGPGEFPPYASMYIDLLPDDDAILRHFEKQAAKTKEFLLSLTKKQLKYRYQPGKWTIREIMVHIIDDERIYAYRALRIGRGDTTPLPGFEQDDYVPYSQADKRSLAGILKEYKKVRASTISLFENFSDEDLLRSGTANDSKVSVRALLYHMAGHELHHLNIIRERYLK